MNEPAVSKLETEDHIERTTMSGKEDRPTCKVLLAVLAPVVLTTTGIVPLYTKPSAGGVVDWTDIFDGSQKAAKRDTGSRKRKHRGLMDVEERERQTLT